MATFRSALSAAVAADPPRADGSHAEDGILGAVLERLRRLIERIDECGQAALLPSTLVRGPRFQHCLARVLIVEKERQEWPCELMAARPAVNCGAPAERVWLHISGSTAFDAASRASAHARC